MAALHHQLSPFRQNSDIGQGRIVFLVIRTVTRGAEYPLLIDKSFVRWRQSRSNVPVNFVLVSCSSQTISLDVCGDVCVRI